MTRFYLFSLFMLLHTNLFSQDQKKINNSGGFGIQLGYSFRQANELSCGLNYLMYRKTDYKSASLFGAIFEGNLLYRNNFSYLGVRLSAEYIYWTKKLFGIQINFSGELNQAINYGFNFKIGLNYGGVYYFYYGYNMYNDRSSIYLSKSSIGLIFRLNWLIFDLENP